MGRTAWGRLIVMGGMDANGNDVSDVWRSQQLGIPTVSPRSPSIPARTALI